MKNIRTVIWDLDETVWFYKDNEPEILCKKINIAELEKFKKQYYATLTNLFVYFKGKIVTYEKLKKYIQEQMPILEEFNISVELFLEVQCNEKKNITVVNKEAVEMMRYFSNIGLKNISITDWIERHQQVALKDFGAMDYIDKIYGCENAYFKNNPEKVIQMTEQLQLAERKDEYIMIGDSLKSDIFFAKKLGIKSVWFNPKKKKNDTNIIPDIEVQSLIELKRYF